MTQAIFPKSIEPWTDRIDQVNVIWANDVNQLAAEIIAIETVLGTMPQVEKHPYIGNPVTYGNIDARLSDLLACTLHPYVELSAQNDFFVYNDEEWNGRFGHCNTFRRVYDNCNAYNGQDITVPCSGLWLITAQQTWEWHDSGYCFHHCYIDNDWRCGDRWDWDFGSAGPSYYQNSRQLTTYIASLQPVAAGKRIQIVSENGTSRNPYHVLSSNFRAYCLRTLPSSALGV